MDYYQKYQKYKFKYLNLLSLNQSGGVTPEKFKQMLENKEGDEFLEDIDFLTHDQIKVKNAVLIDNQVCDINSIFLLINRKYNINIIAINPLTNNPYSLENLVDIRNKLIINKLFNEKEIINNLILLVIPENIKNQLLRLEPEKFEIFFTKNKIKSFKLNLYEFRSLVDYLLNNNTDENNNITEKFKKHINIHEEKDLLFILVPEDNMTPEICKIAVESNGHALKYIPDNKITDEIIISAVKQNSYAFQHLPKDKKTLNICKKIIKENPKELLQIIERDPEISNEQYLEICMQAVIDDIKVIEYVESYKMTEEQYFEMCKIVILNKTYLGISYIPDYEITFKICKLAVENNGHSLQFAPIKKMTSEQYYEICKLAIITNCIALKFVVYYKDKDRDKLDHNQYIEICKSAVKINGIALQFVKHYRLKSEQYNEICKLAIITNCIALKFVVYYKDKDRDKLDHNQYIEICKSAVKINGIALQFVKHYRLKSEQYNEIFQLALQHLDNKSNSNEDIYIPLVIAVQIDGNLLLYVKELFDKYKLTYNQWYKICEKAVEHNVGALEHVPIEKMTVEQYFEICKLAVKKNALALKYVKANKMESEQYFEICLLALED